MSEHLRDAEAWLKAGEEILEENPRVACAQFSHALIKALDALFEEKLGKTPGRHDQAMDFFKELLDKNLIKEEEARYRAPIRSILQRKSAVEYHTEYFSKKDAERWRKQVKRIIRMVKNYVSRHPRLTKRVAD